MTCTLLAMVVGTNAINAEDNIIKPTITKTITKKASTMRANDTKEANILIDEDFSGLTAGTEDTPDGTKLVDAMGDFINPAALKPYSDKLSYKKWGGEGLYSAGGCIAIKDGWFLNTPAGDMSGEVTITFRARLVKGQDTGGENTIDLIFLSRKALVDYGRKTYTLTDEWQTFKFTSNKGEFNATGFQFMSNVNSGTVLIDDIHVESVKKSIATPVAQDAENATEYGFKAVWSPCGEADKYLLNVYSKETNSEVMTVNEGFESINANDNGIIDSDNPNYPDGWEIKWADETKSHAANGMGIKTGKMALRMIDEGDYVCTPKCKEGLTSLSFWLKAEKKQQDVPYGSCIALSFDTDYGLYQFATIDAEQLLGDDATNGLQVNLDEAIAMFDGVYSLKVEWLPVSGDNTTILLDDVVYTTPASPTLNYALHDKEVKADAATIDENGNITYEVSNLNPDIDYYYTVKAANSEFTSEESKEIEVYTVSQPTALEATDVTASSYTANWTSHNKVDFFRVEQIQQNNITEDTNDYEILYEDFSKVTSDFKESDIADGFIEQGEYTSGYRPIDDLTHIAGWKASSTQRVEGWLGGMASSGQTGEIAGAIVTPTIDLSHNDGECNVTVRAWGQEDDWLVIQGVNAAAYAAIRFPAGGFVEQTVTVPVCTAKESLTFYSNNYYPFLIDYIKITQNVKAGEKVSVTTASVHTANSATKSIVMDNPGFGNGHDIYYKVTGLRYYHGDKKDAVASTPSELILVKNPTSGINSAITTEKSCINAVKGGIRICCAQATQASIYTLAGQLAAEELCTADNTFISIAPGVYMVKLDNITRKVVVE